MGERSISRAPLLVDTLLADEIALEREAVAGGLIRYRRMAGYAIRNDHAVTLPVVEEIAFEWMPALKIAIRMDQGRIKRGKSDIGSAIYAAPLISLTPTRMAYVTIRETLGIILKDGGEAKIGRVAYAIGRGVLAEINFDLLRKSDRERDREVDRLGHVKRLEQHFRGISTVRVNHTAKKSLDDPVWDRSVCTHIGIRLLWTLIGCASSGKPDDEFQLAFHVEHRRRQKRLDTWLVLSRSILDRIDAGLDHRGAMRPQYLPMVVPPYRWSDKAEGGYVQIRTPFIAKPTREQKDALDACDLEPIYERLHAISSTAWRPNEWMVDVAQELWQSGGGVCGLPIFEDIPEPPRPAVMDDRERKQFWKHHIAVIEANRYLRAERFRYAMRLDVANRMRAFGRHYLPMHLDFRGRTYAVPSAWTHQGDDFCRGTIEFADPVDVDADGERWLRIHATSMYGYDRAALDVRERWAIEHDEIIRAAAADPIANLDLWRAAKKPWQFLAACRAIVDRTSAQHMPVEIDCTCNGLQHYAALGRDAQGGAAVNLVDAAEPADVYQLVADRMLSMIDEPRWDGIRHLSDLIDRDMAKPPTMTMVYGVTDFGVWRQIRGEANSRNVQIDGKQTRLFEQLVHAALELTVASATSIMRWVRAAVSKILDNRPDMLIRWTSPSGLPVVQPYRRSSRHRIRTILGSVTVGRQQAGMAARGKHMAAIAANYVHCLDAAHLGEVALWAYRSGIPYGAVHDAHRIHASHVTITQQAVRNTFADLHGPRRLSMLRDEWQQRYELSLPPLPPTGDLDINRVRNATYFAH